MRRKFNWYKLVPWIPIIGIPFSFYCGLKGFNTGLENRWILLLSGFWQALVIDLSLKIIYHLLV